jgi:hypothetical protein
MAAVRQRLDHGLRGWPGLLLLVGGLLVGCAGQTKVAVVAPPLAPKRVESPLLPVAAGPGGGRRDAAGTWDWMFRSTTQQGDLRVEQEEWHLAQQGVRLSGYYQRQVVTLSSDQRPFRCNGMLAFVQNTRVRVEGELQSDGLRLREVGADADKGPCDDGNRNLTSYSGQLQGDSLLLSFAPGAEQHLVRRPVGSPIIPLRPESAPPVSEPAEELLATVPIDGVWDWQFRAVDPEGDLHIEHEEWHLQETSAAISGYYQRTLERRRPSGVFPCNGSPQIKTTTRYAVKGQRFGSKVTISEVDYQTQGGPCDNAARRLEQYQGAVLPEGQLMLSWGSGQQTLRKRR